MRIVTCFVEEHNLFLVSLAALICAFGASTSISLLRRAKDRDVSFSHAWALLGGIAAGSSIWCTHFVAMLAFEPNTAVGYEPELTALSLVLIVCTSVAGFLIAAQRFFGAAEMAGVVFGAGVAMMHYVGMEAFSIDALVTWSALYLAISIAWVMTCSVLAFQAVDLSKPLQAQRFSSALLVVAVVGLHFVGMAAMTITPLAPAEGAVTSAVAREMLAFAVTGVAILVVGIVWVSHFLDAGMRHQASSRLRHLASSSADGMIITQNGVIAEVNAAFEHLSGTPRQALIGQVVGAAGFDPMTLVDGAIDRRGLRHSDGEEIPVEITVHTEAGKAGDNLRVYALRDIRPRLEQERRIATLAKTDALTGLSNRAAFLEHLDTEIAALRGTNQLALLAIDLNRFKEVNDLHGHAAGDTVLRALSERMLAVLREGEFLARLGGDEFVALRRTTSREEALEFAERIEKPLFSTVRLEQTDAVCGASIGVAMFPEHAKTATQLMNNADLAMYRAKGSLADTVCFYAETMDEVIRNRRKLIGDLREAISRSQFELHYQVQVDIATQKTIGYEALLRWRHPERGFVSPLEFIHLAEESGLIMPIGEWVLREACKAAAHWDDHLTVAVNLSAIQLHQMDLPEVLEQILAETGLPASRLELETTETSLMQDPERAIHVLNRIKSLGVSVAIDDFGTGYSSLSTLRAFNFDKIKLDKTFIDGIEKDAQARAVMLAVLALGKALEIPVLAEGVETQAQFEFLRSRGCESVQGFLFGQPASLIGRREAEAA